MKKHLDVMGGPKKQFNVRMPLSLRSEIEQLAKARGMKVSQVALSLLEEAVINKCPHCHWGMAPGGTLLRPKPCRFCFGIGRRDLARIHRKQARNK